MQIREKDRRAGFRAISHAWPTLQAALARLHRDGHLGQRCCIVAHNKRGYLPLVYKGGRVHRVYQGQGVGARVVQSLGPKDSVHAWLDVPAGCTEEARRLCASFGLEV